MIPELKEIKKISNLISLFRLLLAFPVFFLIIAEALTEYIWMFLLAAYISDLADGFVARKRNEITEFGKIIDPLADKVFITFLVIALLFAGKIELWYFIVIISRDILILVGGMFITSKTGKVLPSNITGKAAVFLIGFTLLFIITGIEKPLGIVFPIFYYGSIIMSFISVLIYGKRAYNTLKGNL